MTILVIAEHDGAALKSATLNTIAAAQKIGGDIHVLVAGHNAGGAAKAAAPVTAIRPNWVAAVPATSTCVVPAADVHQRCFVRVFLCNASTGEYVERADGSLNDAMDDADARNDEWWAKQ